MEKYAITIEVKDVKTKFTEYFMFLSEAAIGSKTQRNNTVAHESNHVVMKTLLPCGINPTADEHETFCYLLGWVTQEAHNFYIGR